MSKLVCSVKKGNLFLFEKDCIPEVLPKIKHPARTLHEDYVNFLRKEISDRVKENKQKLTQESLTKQSLLQTNRERIQKYKIVIDKWWNESLEKAENDL